ncbi:class I SAM-dependent methyltransferase [Roseiconus lacunae]|uniref:class I SAM-dependent methyltransferase n=1 Tax=Roseiconus lacunae TaxID=2605694 RepID=UPI00308EF0EF|nr:class I SAM-dependent methyltransferase [Stieleria sp. HD01]
MRPKRQSTINSSRVRLENENRAFAQLIPENSMVLDAGAGTAPYRHLFNHTNYETADFQKVDKEYEPATYICDLSAIPVEDNRFDYIIFNQVMEHLPNPTAVLKELNRVLKNDGKIIYTAPLFYEEHEQPYDFFRYTQYGVRHLFKEAGFDVERLEWLEGYFGTVAYELSCMGKYLRCARSELSEVRRPAVAYFALRTTATVAKWLSSFFHQLELQQKFTARGFPKNYVAIARKVSQVK